ncbi:hypothetical protein ACB092_01G257100 [Castanea dentata]
MYPLGKKFTVGIVLKFEKNECWKEIIKKD